MTRGTWVGPCPLVVRGRPSWRCFLCAPSPARSRGLAAPSGRAAETPPAAACLGERQAPRLKPPSAAAPSLPAAQSALDREPSQRVTQSRTLCRESRKRRARPARGISEQRTRRPEPLCSERAATPQGRDAVRALRPPGRTCGSSGHTGSTSRASPGRGPCSGALGAALRRGRRQRTERLDPGPPPRQGPQASQGLFTVSYRGVRRHQRHFLPKLTLQRTNRGTMGSPWARLPLGSAPQPVWDSWRTNLKGLGRRRPEQAGPGVAGARARLSG